MNKSMIQDSMTKSVIQDPMMQSMIQDPMTQSILEDPMSQSMIQDSTDPMTQSMIQDDPMSQSMIQDPMAQSMIQDPMTSSVFGAINGMNGKGSGEPSPTKPELPSVSQSQSISDQPGVRTVPGTNMRCLDDPSFMFDQTKPGTESSSPKESSYPKSSGVRVLEAPEPEGPPQKVGSYKVLEAPDLSVGATKAQTEPSHQTNVHENPVASKTSPYRVLEAPMDDVPAVGKPLPYRVLEAPETTYYGQQQAVPAGASSHDSNPPALVSPSSGRTVTEALDKARSRFDSFWGGNKDKDPPSKV
ncbi:hypothetical protein FHG87_000293 [Trinorchestia longiramus]|nr:hypothetical protein FHG87_000293 [Trinorchestia longiramus]